MKQTFTLVLGLIFRCHTGSCVKTINILGMEQEDSFGLNKLPAIFMGVEKINSLYKDVFKINLLRTTFGPSCSPNGKAVAFANVYYNNRIDASFGPGCTATVEPVARMAASWNILMMITVGTDAIFDNERDFPTLVRTSISVNQFAIFYLEFYKAFSWTSIAIIYDQDATYCPRWQEALEPTLATKGFHVKVIKMKSIATGLYEYKESLVDASKGSRVITVCCHMDNFRKLMIAAHELGMTKGEYVFLMCTRYEGDFFGNYNWYRGDAVDEIAREAWKSVFMVRFRKEVSSESTQFEQALRDRALVEYNYTYDPEPGPEVLSYYDLFLIYGQILNETITEGANYSDGIYMKSKLKRRTFEGLNGQITFDAVGAKEPDFSLYDMNPNTGNFEVVGNYFGATKTLQMNNVSIHWPNDVGPPPNEPKCGFINDNPSCAKKEINLLAIVCGSLVGVLVISLLVVLFAYRRMKRESEINSQWWRIKAEDITFKLSRYGSFGSRKSRLSMLKSTEDLLSASIKDGNFGNEHCGIYQGGIVFLQKTKLVNFNLTRKDLIELKQAGDLPCPNLVKFIGLYHFEKKIYKVTDYCSRGSLQDIVQNDSINLNWDFKAALLTDLTNGMAFLHDSLILVHGRLNSDRCVIDSRFVLKITGFGLTCIHGNNPFKAVKNEHEYLWFAPEVLRENSKISQAADVYSYAIIMFEILTRMAPYEMDKDLLSVKEIVKNIKEGGVQQPCRPQLPCDIEQPMAVQLMKECWDESLFKRPTFRIIKKKLKTLTGITSSHNIMDSLLRRMEQYANNLEDLVSQRTEAFLEEKKKSEELLDQVLPRSVASKLKNGQPVEPEAFSCVTIYFSDIVGFTDISAKSSAIEVVDLLNDLYTMFDAIIDSFDVYKVETIGDAYMVVSGLPVRNGNEHAKQIAQMSLSILRDVRNFRIRHLPNIPLRARIGLHSGPVCAGVVGKKMPRYCLFGDTVNTASRMESHGEAMKIHVSPQAKYLLDTFGIFCLETRGEIIVKGKGQMTTYWLIEKPITIALNDISPSNSDTTSDCDLDTISRDQLVLNNRNTLPPIQNNISRKKPVFDDLNTIPLLIHSVNGME